MRRTGVLRRLTIGLLAALGLVTIALSQAISREAEKVLVSLQDGSSVFVFDPATRSFTRSIRVFVPSSLGQALPPNVNDIILVKNTVWMTVPGAQVSETGTNRIAIIDPFKESVVRFLKAGVTPSGLLLHNGSIFVVNRYGNTIEEIDAITADLVRTIPFSIPKPGASNPPLFLEIDNGKIYLPFPGGFSRNGFIQILDLKTGKLLKSIDFTPISNYGPMAIKRMGRNKIYLGGLNSIAVLDTMNDTLTKTIPLSSSPLYVQSFALAGSKAYAANGVSTVSVIDTTHDAFIREIDIGYHPYACHLRVGIAAGANRVYVGDAGRGLKVIDTTGDVLVATVPTEEPLGPLTVIGIKDSPE